MPVLIPMEYGHAFLLSRNGWKGRGIETLKENGLRDKVKVLIGGAAVSEEFAQKIGADNYCVDGFNAIRVLDAFQESKK